MVGPPGFEPRTNRLCIPLRLSPPLSSLWAGLSLHPRRRGACRLVSTPSSELRLGSGLPYLFDLGFPEFDRLCLKITLQVALAVNHIKSIIQL